MYIENTDYKIEAQEQNSQNPNEVLDETKHPSFIFEQALNEIIESSKQSDFVKLMDEIDILGNFVWDTNSFYVKTYEESGIHNVFMNLLANPTNVYVTLGILKVIFRLAQFINLNDLQYYFPDVNINIIVNLLNHEDFAVQEGTLNLLTNLSKMNPNLRNFIFDSVPFEKVCELTNSPSVSVQKFLFEFLSTMLYLPEFPHIADVLNFMIGEIPRLQLPARMQIFRGICFAIANDKMMIHIGTPLIELVGPTFEELMKEENKKYFKQAEYVLKFCIAMIKSSKDCRFIDKYFMYEVLQIADSNIAQLIINLFDVMLDNCEESFDRKDISVLFKMLEQALKMTAINVKISAAVLIGKVFCQPGFCNEQIVTTSNVISSLAPVLLAASKNDLVQILKWVYKLLSNKSDPKRSELFADQLHNADLSDVLDELAEDEDEDVAKIASMIALEIDCPDYQYVGGESDDEDANQREEEEGEVEEDFFV